MLQDVTLNVLRTASNVSWVEDEGCVAGLMDATVLVLCGTSTFYSSRSRAQLLSAVALFGL